MGKERDVARTQAEAGQSRTYRLHVWIETVAVELHSGLWENFQGAIYEPGWLH